MRRMLDISQVLLLLLLGLHEGYSVIFKMTNAVCVSRDSSWVIYNQCRLRAIKRNHAVLNINVSLLRPVNDVVIHGQVMKRENGYKPWLFNTTVDACQFMRKKNNPLAKLVLDLIKGYTTLNHTCPYEGDQLLKDFYPNVEVMRLPLPTGDYVLILNWYFHGKLTGTIKTYFTFVEDL